MVSKILPAYKYLLEERKLTEDTISTFHLGYCSPEGDIYVGADFPGGMPTLPQTMRNSTIFPIMDLHNACIGVSVRPLVSKPNVPKYINTSYEKADHLYGLSVTYKECLKQQAVYVVEGNISLLQMYQAGIKNCVAMLGSKLSSKQICLLNRFVKKIIMVPDSDKAGMGLLKKLKENIPTKLYDSDISFFYKQLPDGFDPDDFLKMYTKQDFLDIPEEELLK